MPLTSWDPIPKSPASRDWVRSPDEFRHFIGEEIRLDRVTMRKEETCSGFRVYMSRIPRDPELYHRQPCD